MILIVTAQFNHRITQHLENAAVEVLKKKGEKYKIIQVPGAVELTVAVQQFLQSGKYEAAIALGCVIKGATDHYDCVLKSCTEGLTRVALDEGTPVVQGVIASSSFSLAWERRGLGADYAHTALMMRDLLRGRNTD